MAREPEVRTYDSVEAMFEDMRAGEEQANAHLAQEQAGITYDDHWIRFYDIPGRVIIFGHVLTIEAIVEGEMRSATKEDPIRPGEIDHVIKGVRDRLERGYLFGMAYSIITPEGEGGDTHQANAWPISAALFEAARAVDWNIDDLPQEFKVELSNAYLAWGAHEQAKIAQARTNGQ